jgi:hypothetical protein
VNLYGVFHTAETAQGEVLDLEGSLIGERRAEAAR